MFGTLIAPILGAVLNVGMLIAVLYYAITSGGATQVDTIIAGAISVIWLVGGFAYLYIRQAVSGVRVLHPEDHKEKNNISIEAGSV